MAMRVLLVALVAALGLELPSQAELAGWRMAGQEWVSARMAEFQSLQLDAEQALAGSPEGVSGDVVPVVATGEAAPSSRVDLSFEAVVEGMASGFASDLASMERTEPPSREAIAVVEPTRELPSDPAPMSDPVPVAEAPAFPASRLEKISTAVRLTRQAVDAWVSIIQPAPERVADDGSGDTF